MADSLAVKREKLPVLRSSRIIGRSEEVWENS